MTQINAATAKAPDQPENEDCLVHAGHLVGVIDGVTAPANLDSGCVHGVTWYVNSLASQLSKNPDAQVPLPEILAQAINGVRALHESTCDLSSPYTPAAALCLARCHHDQVEYLILADCTFVVDLGGKVKTFTDPRLRTLMQQVRRQANASPIGTKLHDQLQHQATIRKYDLTNKPDGYWIASADPEAAHHAVAGSFPRAGAYQPQRIALLTDGSSRAVDTLRLTDWPGLLDLLATDGPDKLIELIRQAERLLPDSGEPPRRKTHDDASVVYCSLPVEDQ